MAHSGCPQEKLFRMIKPLLVILWCSAALSITNKYQP
jgi:hypothetical protein